MKKTIGILGGMGPKATAYFFDKIVEFTGADSDGSHIPIIILNNPRIPDRSEAILHGGPSPQPLLAEGAKFLEKSGCDFIVMPCVTAHYYYNDIIKNITVPFLHLIEETARFIKNSARRECPIARPSHRPGGPAPTLETTNAGKPESRNVKKNTMPGTQKIGLLATTGVISTRIFQDALEAAGFGVVIPGPANQEKVMEAIYGKEGIKAGFSRQPKEIILEQVSHLTAEGADAVITGCTELPLILDSADISIPLIEPLEILARRAVESANGLAAATSGGGGCKSANFSTKDER